MAFYVKFPTKFRQGTVAKDLWMSKNLDATDRMDQRKSYPTRDAAQNDIDTEMARHPLQGERNFEIVEE